MEKVKQFVQFKLPILWRPMAVLHDWFVEQKLNSARRQIRKQLESIKGLPDPFFIIGVSGGLHLVKLCLSYVPKDVNIVFIANGLDSWEKRWINKNISVPTIIINSLLDHRQVINLLLDNIQKPFGILDCDCFVFNPDLFNQSIYLTNDTLCNSLFVYHNPVLGIDIPQTFFLFLNTDLLNTIRNKYRISDSWRIYNHFSEVVKNQLLKIGIDDNHYPEDYRNIYDTLRLIFSLGLSEGLLVNNMQKIPLVPSQVFHVGGTSWPNHYSIDNLWQLRGSYFWRFALEKNPDESLRNHYWKTYGKLSSAEMLNISPDTRDMIGEATLVFIDNIISGHYSYKGN